ncbi:hypothetical protein PanWU01x14_294940 [Parasponia andersonii]|uniref:Uncharacterized protein n=1 Tax=Parasponia andersonii TaxID=3476 RepID=A0A2P5AW33_PARAD|nr:hypothetical protein PanWU01x14_294940 [Parasponia andersonii]
MAIIPFSSKSASHSKLISSFIHFNGWHGNSKVFLIIPCWSSRRTRRKFCVKNVANRKSNNSKSS